jgi:hypothetical protein
MTRVKPVKPLRAWAIAKGGAVYQGIWGKRKQAVAVLTMWQSDLLRVIPVLITPAPPPKRRKK